jgi:hypothetical protein
VQLGTGRTKGSKVWLAPTVTHQNYEHVVFLHALVTPVATMGEDG